jgi:hypothetical protein
LDCGVETRVPFFGLQCAQNGLSRLSLQQHEAGHAAVPAPITGCCQASHIQQSTGQRLTIQRDIITAGKLRQLTSRSAAMHISSADRNNREGDDVNIWWELGKFLKKKFI